MVLLQWLNMPLGERCSGSVSHLKAVSVAATVTRDAYHQALTNDFFASTCKKQEKKKNEEDSEAP